MWPYDFSLTLRHFTFEGVGGGGLSAFWNSVRMSAYTAVFGTILTFGAAYLVEKSHGMQILRQSTAFLATIPLALPGLVIGLAYILFFNKGSFELFGFSFANPFNSLYGIMAILEIAMYFFVSSMATVSALIFLYTSEPPLAAVAVVNMDDAGDTAAAAAGSTRSMISRV